IARGDAEVDRGRERRGCRGGASRGGGDCRVPPADDGAVGYRLRAAGAGERNPAPEVLGCGVRNAEEIGGDSTGDEREDGGLLDLAVEGRRKFGNKHKGRRERKGHREDRRGREFAGQDYCALEWDGDVRREGYCLPTVEIRIAGEGFSLPEVAECPAGANGLGDDERGK